MKRVDLLVIGAGAGLNVAAGAAEQGMSVVIVEKGPLGGTCLNRGCIPSKMVIHSAEVAETVRNASRFGVQAEFKGTVFSRITGHASKVVDADARQIENALKKGKNPRLIQGTARFVGERTIEVNGENIQAKKVVIAAGARPTIPAIPGLKDVPYMTSTEALRRKTLPKSLLVIGGGYIGVELGNFYGSLGSKVTVVQRGSLLLPREDKDIAETFTRIWKKKYRVLLNSSITNLTRTREGITATIGRKKITTEAILVATGVTPNSDLLDLSKAGVKTNEKGFIRVNKYLETSAKNVWALGDIAGVYMFRHSANLEAEYVLNAVLGTRQVVDYYPMPHAIFTSPQIAGVGLTEQEAKNYVLGTYQYKNTGMGEALQEEDGFVKFIIEKKTRKMLGFHALGPEASILLHEVVVAMKADKPLNLLQNAVHVHPSLNEVVQRAALSVPED